jgi:hypothetical protein
VNSAIGGAVGPPPRHRERVGRRRDPRLEHAVGARRRHLGRRLAAVAGRGRVVAFNGRRVAAAVGCGRSFLARHPSDHGAVLGDHRPAAPPPLGPGLERTRGGRALLRRAAARRRRRLALAGAHDAAADLGGDGGGERGRDRRLETCRRPEAPGELEASGALELVRDGVVPRRPQPRHLGPYGGGVDGHSGA